MPVRHQPLQPGYSAFKSRLMGMVAAEADLKQCALSCVISFDACA
jgi:hypothetical protein